MYHILVFVRYLRLIKNSQNGELWYLKSRKSKNPIHTIRILSTLLWRCMASPTLKRHLSSSLRQRGSSAKSGSWARDRLYLCVRDCLKLAFSATLDAVPRPLFRACYHSLSRLKDACYYCPIVPSSEVAGQSFVSC